VEWCRFQTSSVKAPNATLAPNLPVYATSFEDKEEEEEEEEDEEGPPPPHIPPPSPIKTIKRGTNGSIVINHGVRHRGL